MLVVKAVAVGIATALALPAVVWILSSLSTLVAGYYAVGFGVDVHIHDTYFTVWPVALEQLPTLLAVGFAVGFAITLWRAYVIEDAR